MNKCLAILLLFTSIISNVACAYEGYRGGYRGRGYYGGYHGRGYGLRWVHPYFIRPIYGWNWVDVRTVTCVARNSRGQEFPVTASDGYGVVYRDRLPQIEDMAMDRCYQETGGDTSCALLLCTPGY